jgi:hypothetical protein
MKFFLASILAASCHASESRNMPDTAKDAVHRAKWEYQKYGAKLPKTRFIWAEKGQCPRGCYAVAYRHRGYWVVFLNATDFTWPRWEVSLDAIVLHEISRTLEWGDCPADSVAERVVYDHLSVSDLSRIVK